MLATDGVAGFTTRKVAEGAQTSPPAVYELFGDKAGLVREVFFEGFRLLGDVSRGCGSPPTRALTCCARSRRSGSSSGTTRCCAEVMFSRPFADFDPGPAELEAGAATREFIVHRVRRCIDAGIIDGDETDIAHVLLALTQGLATQETAGWLGTSRASVDRRWDLAVHALLDGFAPASPAVSTGLCRCDRCPAAAGGRAQCPGRDGQRGHHAEHGHLGKVVAGREVGGHRAGVGEERAGVGPFLEQRRRGTSRAAAPSTFQVPSSTRKYEG